MSSWMKIGQPRGQGSLAGTRRRFPKRFWVAAFAVLAIFAMGVGWAIKQRAEVEERDAARARAESTSAVLARLPTVVLISMDGTRPADVSPDRLPSLVALGEQGAAALGLTPVDPTNTFPNHVSLATGVRPEVHRLVNNNFIDPERGKFKRDAPNTWIESEPIWSVAERHGLTAVSFYWVGSEGPWQGGPGPSETRKFSSRTLEKTKVDQILEWLSMPDSADRPRLITAWFHGADGAAHDAGPESEEVTESLEPQDREVARLIREMEARNLFATTTLIFVSDHGMVEAGERVNLTKALKDAGLSVSVIGIGGFSSVTFRKGTRSPGTVAQAVSAARALGLEAWPRESAPVSWHVDDPRFGDVVVRAPMGMTIVTARTRIKGVHGYSAAEPAMSGLLVARGRGVIAGTELGQVSGLAIAPTVLHLLGLPIPPQMKEKPIPGLIRGLDSAPPAGGRVH